MKVVKPNSKSMAIKKTLFRKKPSQEYQNDTYKIQSFQKPCAICGNPTYYKSSLAADHICSEECSSQLWYDVFVKLHTDRRRRKPQRG